MTDKDFLDNLAVGDTVVVESNDSWNVTKVARFTKTQVIITGGGKFRRATGLGGNDWNRSSLVEPTQERLDKIRHSILVAKLRHFNWKSLPLDTLNAINALVGKKT